MAEVWDLYYPNGIPAGRTMVRGEKVPAGMRHLVCEVLARHRDGDYLLMRRCASKPNYPGFWEGTAGGSALLGEDTLTCIQRELLEETGLRSKHYTFVASRNERNDTIFHTYLCVVDCDKNAVRTQEGETDAFEWLSEGEFIEFVNSDRIIDMQYRRWEPWFRKMGYVK